MEKRSTYLVLLFLFLIFTTQVTCNFLDGKNGAGSSLVKIPEPPSVPFQRLPFGAIKPSGWIQEQLKMEAEHGYAIHLHELTTSSKSKADLYTFDARKKTEMETSWWNGETTGNWLDGLVQLAYTADDPEAKKKADSLVAKMLSFQEEDGYLGIYTADTRYKSPFSSRNGEFWTQTCLMRGLLAYYEFTGRQEVLAAVKRAVDLSMSKYGKDRPYWPAQVGRGGPGHNFMFVDLCEWLWNLTGDKKYVEFAQFLYDTYNEPRDWYDTDILLENLADPEKLFHKHGAHVMEYLRVPLFVAYTTGDTRYWPAVDHVFLKTDRHLNAGGACISDEDILGRLGSPDIGAEYCTMLELLNSLKSGVQKTGRADLGDRMEVLAFNAAQGARFRDCKAIQYCTRDNQHEATIAAGRGGRFKLSPTHEDVAVCCNPNAVKFFPSLVQGLWMKEAEDDGLVAISYVPNTVETRIQGIPVRIETVTDYPFDDQVRMTIRTEKPVKFNVRLRIPEWEENMKVRAPGTEMRREDGWYVLSKEWETGNEVYLSFAPEIVRKIAVNGSGVYWQRGPLVYSLPLSPKKEKIKDYSVPGFHDWDVTPVAANTFWDYVVNENSGNFVFQSTGLKADSYPWETTPFAMTGTLAVRTTGQMETVRLVPMGTTLLRHTVFPDGAQRNEEPVSGSGWLQSDGNVALRAEVTVDSTAPGYDRLALINGVAEGYPGNPTAEWASARGGVGTRARLFWEMEEKVECVWLYDRPNMADHVISARLEFSDGYIAEVGPLPNDGRTPYKLRFSPRTISWLEVTVTGVGPSTRNVGFSEIAVFTKCPADAPPGHVGVQTTEPIEWTYDSQRRSTIVEPGPQADGFEVVTGAAQTGSGDGADVVPERGVSSRVPADRWDHGFLTGNGRMAAVFYGQPANETVLVNHERLFLPVTEKSTVLPDLGRYLPDVRRIIEEETAKESYWATDGFTSHRLPHELTLIAAQQFLNDKEKEEGWHTPGIPPYIPGFDLKIETPDAGPVTNYLRTTDFQTGEVTVRWEDARGAHERRLFVSRPDNTVVLSVKGPGSGNLNCVFHAPSIVDSLIKSVCHTDGEWITFHNAYARGKGGYDAVIRVVPRGGRVESDGGRIRVSGADEALVLMKIAPFGAPDQSSVDGLKNALERLAADYADLLTPHAREHGEMFNRVALDLGASKEERRLDSEQLIERARATGHRQAPSALLEKIYDASRFYFIASAGELPPNLQGKWNGDWRPAWRSDYHLDINLQMAMDSPLSGNMMEGMEGFFDLIESWLPDWRQNARKIYGARGVMAALASTTSGLSHSVKWASYTSGAAWLASYFYDYYLFTGDKEFLAGRAMPFMKEIALFYEDFLFEDQSGKYRFSPSLSPESGFRENATMEIACAKELLRNLIEACNQLGIEEEGVKKWQAMLDKMPPYQIGPDGDLSEWADGSFLHVYAHRHVSPFYPVFRSFEFSPDATPELWKAAGIALEKKRTIRSSSPDNWGISYGESMQAQSAAYLGRGDVVEEKLNALTRNVYPSLFFGMTPARFSADFARHLRAELLFNFEGVGAFPDIINRSLAFSWKGTLDLLRSVPPGWQKGSIGGILVRGQIRIDRLEWDQTEGVVKLELTSAIPQEITLRLPGSREISSLKVMEGSARAEITERGKNARRIILPANQKVKLEARYDTRSPLF